MVSTTVMTGIENASQVRTKRAIFAASSAVSASFERQVVTMPTVVPRTVARQVPAEVPNSL